MWKWKMPTLCRVRQLPGVQAASLFFYQRIQFLLDKAEEVFVVSARHERKT